MTVTPSHPRLLVLALLALAVGAALALGSFAASHTSGFGNYKSALVSKYALAGTKLDDCTTCHNPDFSRNPFGQAVEGQLGQGNDIDTALTNVESLDSDGDGASNIDELNAGTFPGDASDAPAATEPTPTPAGTPAPTGTPTVTATVTLTPTGTPTVTLTPAATPAPTITPAQAPDAGGRPSGDGTSLIYVLIVLGGLAALAAAVVIYVALPRRGP